MGKKKFTELIKSTKAFCCTRSQESVLDPGHHFFMSMEKNFRNIPIWFASGVGLEIVPIITQANKWLLHGGRGRLAQDRILPSFICKCTKWFLSLQCAIQHVTVNVFTSSFFIFFFHGARVQCRPTFPAMIVCLVDNKPLLLPTWWLLLSSLMRGFHLGGGNSKQCCFFSIAF
jgi:hypothetical protein